MKANIINEVISNAFKKMLNELPDEIKSTAEYYCLTDQSITSIWHDAGYDYEYSRSGFYKNPKEYLKKILTIRDWQQPPFSWAYQDDKSEEAYNRFFEEATLKFKDDIKVTSEDFEITEGSFNPNATYGKCSLRDGKSFKGGEIIFYYCKYGGRIRFAQEWITSHLHPDQSLYLDDNAIESKLNKDNQIMSKLKDRKLTFTELELFALMESRPNQVVGMIINGTLDNCEIVPTNGDPGMVDFIKKSLKRKAFRYVATMSSKGTIEATLTATKCGFYSLEDGFIQPIGAPNFTKMTFTDRAGRNVMVIITSDHISFFYPRGVKMIKRWTGLHSDYVHVCVDIPKIWEDLDTERDKYEIIYESEC